MHVKAEELVNRVANTYSFINQISKFRNINLFRHLILSQTSTSTSQINAKTPIINNRYYQLVG